MLPLTREEKQNIANKNFVIYAKKNLMIMVTKSIARFKIIVITQANKETLLKVSVT